MYLLVQNQNEANYQFLINKRKSIGSKDCNDPEVFSKYSNDVEICMKILLNKIQIKNVKH